MVNTSFTMVNQHSLLCHSKFSHYYPPWRTIPPFPILMQQKLVDITTNDATTITQKCILRCANTIALYLPIHYITSTIVNTAFTMINQHSLFCQFGFSHYCPPWRTTSAFPTLLHPPSHPSYTLNNSPQCYCTYQSLIVLTIFHIHVVYHSTCCRLPSSAVPALPLRSPRLISIVRFLPLATTPTSTLPSLYTLSDLHRTTFPHLLLPQPHFLQQTRTRFSPIFELQRPLPHTFRN